MKSYDSVHHSIRRRLGRAPQYQCTDCGNNAFQWSYCGDCPDEITGTNGLSYCIHDEHYAPRCKSCHIKLDARSGEAHYRTELNDSIVEEIRTRYAGGGVTQRGLAREYGMTQAGIWMILNGRTWKHLPVEKTEKMESINATLTAEQANQIRTRYAAGGISQRTLASEYGVSQKAVWSIVNNQTWIAKS